MEQLDMFAMESKPTEQQTSVQTKDIAQDRPKIPAGSTASPIKIQSGIVRPLVPSNGQKQNDNKFVYLPLKDIDIPQWTYKNEDPLIILKLKGLLLKYGQVRNIQVRKLKHDQYEIINGKSLFIAMTELGFKQAFCYIHDGISAADAMRIAVEIEQTYQQVDHIKLSELMQQLSEHFTAGQLSMTMPYTLEDIQELIKLHKFDWGQFSGMADPNQSSLF